MKTKKVFFTVLIAGLVALYSGCVRSDADNPSIFGQSAQRLSIEGWANPATLFIPSTLVPQVATITVRVSSLEQQPLGGRQVIFQQVEGDGATGMSWGYFEGSQLTIKKTLDSQGYCQANYYFPGAYTVSTDAMIYIKVTLLNIDTMRIDVFDLIPVFLRVSEY